MKKKILIAVGSVVLVAVLAVAVWVLPVGAPAGEKVQISEDTAYVGDHIAVTKSDYNSYCQRAQLAAPDEDVSEEALNNIAMREIWCYLGHEAGIPDDDEAFQTWLKQYRETIEAAENYKDVLKYMYMESGSKTPEEFWQWAEASETFRKEWYATLYLAQLQEEFQAEQARAMTDGETPSVTWNEYLKEYKKKAIENEHLRKVDGTEKE